MGYNGGGVGGETKNGLLVRIFFRLISHTVTSRVSRDIFYCKGHFVLVKSNRCHAIPGIPVLADNAFHFIHKLSIE